MKIGSWLGLPSKPAPAGRSTAESTVALDRADGLDRRTGLGDGFALENGQVVTSNWLGRTRTCEPGPSMQALVQGHRVGWISAEEIRTLEKYPQATLLVLGEPSPALTALLQSWPPEQRQQFQTLLGEVGADYRQTGRVQVVDREHKERLNQEPGPTFFLGSALEKLALNGKLLGSRDQAGHSLLENLVALRQACAKDGQAGQDLFAWSLLHSAYSKRTFHQAQGKGTCGAATLGYVLWQENPSQMVGALKDWTYQGQTVTRSGTSQRPEESIDSRDGTPVADQILQASLMNLADPEYTYSLVEDRFRRADGHVRERGLLPQHQEHLLNSLSQRDWSSQALDSEQIREVQSRAKGPLPVTLEWATGQGLHSLHLLSVQKVNDTHVYLRDPAGDMGVVLPDSSQQLLGSGFQRMSRQEFDQRLQQGLVPQTPATRSGWLSGLKQACSQSGLSGLFFHTSAK